MSKTPNNPDESVIKIPDNASAVRYMAAYGTDTPYRSLATLAEARQHPDAAMIMEADYGGQILLTCPVRHVRATEQVLRLLLADLEGMTWGRGFRLDETEPSDGARIYYEPLRPISGVMGGMGGGVVIDGVWEHPEIERMEMVQGQVIEIVAGSRSRLDLREGYPRFKGDSFREAQAYGARIVVRHRKIGGHLLNISATCVKGPEHKFEQLLDEIDAILPNWPDMTPIEHRKRNYSISFEVDSAMDKKESIWLHPALEFMRMHIVCRLAGGSKVAQLPPGRDRWLRRIFRRP